MKPLSAIGWFHGHRAAIYWLGILCRRPKQLLVASAGLSRGQQAGLALKIYLHGLPYMVLVAVTLRTFLLATFHMQMLSGLPFSPFDLYAFYNLQQIATELVGGLVGGFVGGLVGGLVVGLVVGLVGGLIGGLGFGLGFEIGFAPSLLVIGLVIGLLFGLVGGLVMTGPVGGLVDGLVGGLIGGLVGGLVVGPVGYVLFGFVYQLGGRPGLMLVVGLVVGLSYIPVRAHAYYWPIFWWITWPKPLARFYRYHPVVWDDCCAVPYPGLSRSLVALANHDRGAAEREIERLLSSYPAQRGPALKARTILIAQDAAGIARFAELPALAARLPEGKRGYLAQTRRLRELVEELVALASRAESGEVPALRAAQAAELCLRVREVRDQIAGFAEPIGNGFLKAAEHWQKLAEALRVEARATAEHAARPQVFRAGDKILDRGREAFTVRAEVLHELQQQLLLATGCPGIVLYGRRRVGKSSILYNLQGLLPVAVRSAVISLQNAGAFCRLPGLLDQIQTAVVRATSGVPGGRPVSDPPRTLATFQEFLNQTNQILDNAREKLILALDEYESLDTKIGEGVFGEDLLSCLRESLQSHRNIIWVLAGSHEISELTHAPWTSYLVSARTVEVPMFTLEETRALLTDPLKHAPRRPELAEERPRFQPEFWGPLGVEGIYQQAGGWPHLVQLLAETLLDLVNRKSLAAVDQALFEEGLDKAIVRGHNVLYQLLLQECQSAAESEYLLGFGRADTQPPPSQDSVHRALRRRLLVEEVGREWRLRVPLMQRWLRKRG